MRQGVRTRWLIDIGRAGGMSAGCEAPVLRSAGGACQAPTEAAAETCRRAERKARIPPTDGTVPQARSHLVFIRGWAVRSIRVYYERDP